MAEDDRAAEDADAAASRTRSEAEKVARDYLVEVSGKRFDVKVIGEATGVAAAGGARRRRKPRRSASARRAGGSGGSSEALLASPLQGSIFKVAVEQGAEVDEGDLICVIEAMKMENEITAHRDGKVSMVSDRPLATRSQFRGSSRHN